MCGAGIAPQICPQLPEDVIYHWLICIVTLEALNVSDEISSLGTANWWQNNAWSWWPITQGCMPHLLPQLCISAAMRAECQVELLMFVLQMLAAAYLLKCRSLAPSQPIRTIKGFLAWSACELL